MTRQVYSRDTRFDAVKTAVAFAATGGGTPQVRNWAVGRWGEAGAPLTIEKAEVPALSVGDIDSSSTDGLVDRALFTAVRERAVLLRLKGLRRTGFRIRSTTISNSTAAWVREGGAIPLLRATVDNVGLDPAKIAALSVWTKTALESSPGIEELVFNDLARAFADALDLALLDPLNDGSGVAPASLTNGAPFIAATSDFGVDLAELLDAFDGSLADAYFATTPAIAVALSSLPAGRDLGARGGDLAGIPVLTSKAAPAGQLSLIDPTGIMVAYDGDLELGTSTEGTVEMLDSSLTGDSIAVVPGTAASTIPLWQTNSASIRAIGRFAWATAKPGSVASIAGLYPTVS
ncbi:phage major capsid protein [Altererythrobacter sp. Root672]|uniref:phage major capsid protein n=1 Tax=Altererythrobacter sp. Root672 TaxID=1736584 RepID=UPI00138EFE80|nr:phage major capsid protein [Altererythrobacter sp. Root672]